MTIVEECNKELTGVGAIIAFNSHPRKGNIADFVITAIINNVKIPTPTKLVSTARMYSVVPK